MLFNGGDGRVAPLHYPAPAPAWSLGDGRPTRTTVFTCQCEIWHGKSHHRFTSACQNWPWSLKGWVLQPPKPQKFGQVCSFLPPNTVKLGVGSILQDHRCVPNFSPIVEGGDCLQNSFVDKCGTSGPQNSRRGKCCKVLATKTLSRGFV